MAKQSLRLTLCFLICFSIPSIATAQIVEIPDPNLRAVIEEHLGKAPGATITVADMATLIDLDAPIPNISDLTGLQYATNLKTLALITESASEDFINGNAISDLSPLAGLTNLTHLWLWNNAISDLSPLAGLTNLEALVLPNNAISDLSPLAGLINLTVLWIDFNAISDISPLAGLTNLTILWLNGNAISDISAIAGLTNLRELWLSFNPISDISPLAGLTNLAGLFIGDNPISDISPIAGLTNLRELTLYNNSITDISPIAGLTNLRELRLQNNSISDISAIAGLTNLRELWLQNNSISDISAIAGLTNLTELWLYSNSISDLSPLVENTGLRYGDLVKVKQNFLNAPSINTHIPALQSRGVTVEFDNIVVRPEDIAQTVNIPDPNLRAAIAKTRSKTSGNDITVADMLILTKLVAPNANISDLTGLEHATNLMRLYLNQEYVKTEDRYINSNSVSDLSPLADLTNLTRLDLGHNSISDISPLAGLTNLTHLGLWNNSISDISLLAGLTQLTYLDLEGNSISDISAIAGLINLEHLDLWSNSVSDISSLTGLTNLTELDLWNNSISDISSLTGLTQLTYLDIGDNSISDISPLIENTGLGSESFVEVTGNPLNAPSINTHIPALQNRGVEVNFDDTVAQPADVNGDGVVNILDLVAVASQFGKRGQNLAADVNSDGIVDVRDLVLVAGVFGDGAAAPSAQPQAAEILSAAAVRGWLTDAKALEINDPIMERGIMVLQQLLASLTPTETQLLPNYPNPFNPETWIPYRLAKDAFVTLTIYDRAGQVVRTIDIGHQTAAAYESRSQAIYWDGRNQVGEKVASGVYFYHLSAGDYSATRKMLILK